MSEDVSFGDGRSSANQPAPSSLLGASSLLGNAFPSMFGGCVPQRSLSFTGNVLNPFPIFEHETREDGTEASIVDARQILDPCGPSSDDVSSSFGRVTELSGPKRKRPLDDRRKEDENDTPTRRRLSRNAPAPVPKQVD
ncbi:hypothetical protein FRC05_010929 [Tulasnella sp. 425]|nr:hypothetical protein FRC05_010929 [Tulasnella sp. 425]